LAGTGKMEIPDVLPALI